MNTPLNFSSEFVHDGIDYFFTLVLKESKLVFTVNKPLDSTFWETELNYPDYQEENSFLLLMKIDKFFNYIQNSIEMKQFKLKKIQKGLSFEFWLEIGLGNFTDKYPFTIELEKKVMDLAENVSEMATHIKKLENQYDMLKSKIEVDFKDCELNLKKKMNDTISEFIEMNKASVLELKTQYEKIIKNNKMFQKIKVVNPVISKLKQPREINFSNNNKTMEKNSTQNIYKYGDSSFPFGIKGVPISKEDGVYQFSISLDNFKSKF